MKQDNKKLYESIMTSVAKEVKKALNENKEDYSIAQKIFREITSDLDTKCFLDIVWRDGENDSQSSYTLYSNGSFASTINEGSKKILSFENKCFDGDIVFDTNSNIINNIMELEQSDSKKYGYIIFEKEKLIRSKNQPVYIFYIKLSDFGIEFIKSLMDKRDERFNRDKNQNPDKLEAKLSDLNVYGRMNKFLSKKYGLSNFAIEDIKYMCENFAYTLLDYIEHDNVDNGDFEDDDWDVTKYPKHRGYGPMGGFGPIGFGRRGHVNIKKVRDISKRIETTVFEILEDIKNNKNL